MTQQREETVLPPEASRSGQNATYIPCEVRHARQNYGVCLFIVKAYDEDKLQQNMADCARAITGGYCEARKMQAKEIEAGRSLYFKAREIPTRTVKVNPDMTSSKSIDKTSPSYMRGWNAVGGKSTRAVPVSRPAARPVSRTAVKTKVKPAKPKSDFEKGMQSESGSMTQVINDIAKKEAKPVITQTVAKPAPKPEAKPEAKPATDNSSEARMRRAQRIAELMKGRQQC